MIVVIRKLSEQTTLITRNRAKIPFPDVSIYLVCRYLSFVAFRTNAKGRHIQNRAQHPLVIADLCEKCGHLSGDLRPQRGCSKTIVFIWILQRGNIVIRDKGRFSIKPLLFRET